jgi:hypothetical protein
MALGPQDHEDRGPAIHRPFPPPMLAAHTDIDAEPRLRLELHYDQAPRQPIRLVQSHAKAA